MPRPFCRISAREHEAEETEPGVFRRTELTGSDFTAFALDLAPARDGVRCAYCQDGGLRGVSDAIAGWDLTLSNGW